MSETAAAGPLVSVIIPVYNAAKYLRETLDCVCNQTLRNIEIICVDDGSTDDSLGILQEYAARDERFRILQQKNQYAGVARNNGMAVAKGKYLSFLDADDLFEPDMLEKMSVRAEETGADMVCCDADEFDDTDRTRTLKPLFRLLNHIGSHTIGSCELKALLEKGAFRHFSFCPWNKMYLASYVRETNNTWQTTPYCNDVAFVAYSLYISRKAAFIAEPLVKYRVRHNSISHHSNRDVCVFAKAWGLAKTRMQEDGASTALLNSLFNVALKNTVWFISTLTSPQREKLRKICKDEEGAIFVDMLKRNDSIYENQIQYAHVKGFFRPIISFIATDTPAWGVERKLESFAGLPFYDYEILYAAAPEDERLMEILEAQAAKNPLLRIVSCPAGDDAAGACRRLARGRILMHIPNNLKLRTGIAPALRQLAESSAQGDVAPAPYCTRQARHELFYRSRSNRRSWCLFGKPVFTVFYTQDGQKQYFLLGKEIGSSENNNAHP